MLDELWATITESWDDFWALDWRWQRLIMGGIAAAIFMAVVAWKVMLPLILLAIGTTFYLRRSRDSGSL